MNMVIGLVGEKGSGKGTFIRLLQEIAQGKTVERIASSDILGETLDIWDIPRTRRALQDMAIIMNTHFGDTALAHATHERIRKSTTDIVVFDGVRWLADEKMLRSLPNNLIVYVTCDVRARYERTRLRHEKKDDSTASFEQFLEEEKIRTELDIPDIGSRADVKIVNSGDVEEYKNEVKKVYEKWVAI